jgi:hypothetical protein
MVHREHKLPLRSDGAYMPEMRIQIFVHVHGCMLGKIINNCFIGGRNGILDIGHTFVYVCADWRRCTAVEINNIKLTIYVIELMMPCLINQVTSE